MADGCCPRGSQRHPSRVERESKGLTLPGKNVILEVWEDCARSSTALRTLRSVDCLEL